MGNEAATRVSCGDHTSENVGMSSEGRVRISSAECPRVPGEGSYHYISAKIEYMSLRKAFGPTDPHIIRLAME